MSDKRYAIIRYPESSHPHSNNISYLKLPIKGTNKQITNQLQNFYDNWKQKPMKCLCECGGIKAPEFMEYIII